MERPTMVSAIRKVRRGLRTPRLAGLLLTLMLLSSCVLPMTIDFYSPTAEGGSQARAREPHTLSVILFRQGEIIVGMNTDYWAASGPIIANRVRASITIEVPDGNVVKLARDYVEVSEPSGNPWKAPLSRPRSTLSVDAPLVGKSNVATWFTARGWGNTNHAAYPFHTMLYEGPEQPELLTVRLPPLDINGSEVLLPPITLTLSSEWLLVSLP